jgi:hypothetical protein
MTLRATSRSLALPHIPELQLAGRERPFWSYLARRQMWDPNSLTEDIDEMVHSVEQPARQATATGCENNR